MTAPEAVLLILQSASMGKGGEIFLLDMGRPLNILTLAKNLIELSGYEPDKDIPVVFSGLRPGEKLSERLYDDEEELIKTSNPKILLVKAKPVNREIIIKDIEYIEKLSNEMLYPDLLKKLKDIVPTLLQEYDK